MKPVTGFVTRFYVCVILRKLICDFAVIFNCFQIKLGQEGKCQSTNNSMKRQQQIQRSLPFVNGICVIFLARKKLPSIFSQPQKYRSFTNITKHQKYAPTSNDCRANTLVKGIS